MKFNLMTFWPYLVILAIIAIAVIVSALTTLKNSAFAKKYPILQYVSQLGIDIGNDALSLLQANPTTLTPAQALAWAENELSKTIPADALALLSDLEVSNAARRGLITAANQSTASDITRAVQTTLQPTPGTVKVFPPASGTTPPAPATLAARITALEGAVFKAEDKPVWGPRSPSPTDHIDVSGKSTVGIAGSAP
jgi:hypothetical protein